MTHRTNCPPTSKLRVCAFGTYEKDYPRNAIVLAGLRREGAVVYECHEPIWQGQHDKSMAHRGAALLALAGRVVRAYLALIVRYLHMPPHEMLLVGYIGQHDMLLAWVLSRLRGVLLVFNPNISLYDTFCDDRARFRPQSLTGRVLWLLDHLSCRLADLVFLDTAQHCDYFARTFRLPASRFRVVPVGSDDQLFFPAREPRSSEECVPDRSCEVLFVGKFIPLHGCETIVHAAALLRHEPIHITMVGVGQDYAQIVRLVGVLSLTNITMPGWLPYENLPAAYANADICLGIFGSSAKARRVIPNKVYAGMAMRVPVLTADTPAVRAELCPGEDVWVCQPANAEDLARQLKHLADHPALRQHIAEQGYQAFRQRYTVRAIGEQVYRILWNTVYPDMG